MSSSYQSRPIMKFENQNRSPRLPSSAQGGVPLAISNRPETFDHPFSSIQGEYKTWSLPALDLPLAEIPCSPLGHPIFIL